MNTNDCLVKKLNGILDNPNVPIYGELEIDAVQLSSIVNNGQIRISAIFPVGEEYSIRVGGNGYFATTVEGLDTPETRMTVLPEGTKGTGNVVWYYFKNDTYKVYIKSKYLLKGLFITNGGSKRNHLFHFNISSLEYCENLYQLDVSGNINVEGDVSTFAKLKNFKNITAAYCNLYGNIINFGNMKISQNGSVSTTYLDLGFTKINGTVESFVEKQVENGQTTTIPFRTYSLMSSEVTFGGHGKEDIPNANNSRQTWLEWDYSNGRRKIILYYSSTSSSINIQPNECDYIYVQGATAAEISAWETAGKTVVHWSDAS
jgi:hypothetical protein